MIASTLPADAVIELLGIGFNLTHLTSFPVLSRYMDPFSITVGALGITQFAISSIGNLREFINGLDEAKDVLHDVTSDLEAIQLPLSALENLQISDDKTYLVAKEDLENTGVAEAVNKCGQTCADFTKRLEQWTKHSTTTKLSLRDRLSVGLWNKEKIRTFRTQVHSCQAIVQFAIDSTQLYVKRLYASEAALIKCLKGYPDPVRKCV